MFRKDVKKNNINEHVIMNATINGKGYNATGRVGPGVGFDSSWSISTFCGKNIFFEEYPKITLTVNNYKCAGTFNFDNVNVTAELDSGTVKLTEVKSGSITITGSITTTASGEVNTMKGTFSCIFTNGTSITNGVF